MRIGWLADPRAHLAGLGVGIGAFLFFPEMSEVTGRVEKVAGQVEQGTLETILKMGEDARLALGLDGESAT